MTIETKTNKYLQQLQDKAYSIIDKLSIELILQHCMFKLKKLPFSPQRKLLQQEVESALRSFADKPVNLGDISNILISEAIKQNNSELLEAIIALKPEAVKKPFQYESDTIKGKKTALILAASMKRLNLVKLLVNVEGLNINYGPSRTALDEAIFVGDLEIVQLLIQAGAKPTQHSLQIACSQDRLAIIQELVRVQGNEPFDYNAALMSTIGHGQLGIVQYLVNDLKANVNYVEEISEIKHHSTPFILAIQYGKPAIAQFLKEAGANAEATKQYFNMTDLSFAAFMGDQSI